MTNLYIFPGQGSQYVGMGQDIYEHYPVARSIYDRASEGTEFRHAKAVIQ